MCGIAGLLRFGTRTPPIDVASIEMMSDAMAHRGPDGAGAWVAPDGRVGLGHRRLSIIDLSDAAGQPMRDVDETVHVTFNGEIYNHIELRQELEAVGHVFRTDHSDTEVIVHGFKQWGIDCVQHFRGMFAFALWDAREQALWLVRDRIGVKPLYWTQAGGRLAFASEIKALLVDPSVPRHVNEEGLFHYLSFLTTPAPDTLFEGVQKLPGGCWMRISVDGSMREQRYWDALENAEDLRGVDEEEIAERILAELRISVALRKVSDVPVGVFLSGGIDSSTNAALFAESGGAVKTFSIGYDQDYGSYTNELAYARSVAEKVGADHHELRLTVDDLIDFLPRMVELQDEPIADPVCVPVYYVSKLARENGVVVCQVGEGADELFWGYPNWKKALRMQRTNDATKAIPNFARRAGLAALRMAGKERTLPYDWLARAANGHPIFWGGAEGFTHRGKSDILSSRLRAKFSGRSSWEAIEPIRERFQANSAERGPLDWMSYLDLNFRLPELLLMRVDKMSMGVSLEARVPFLDHKFVELAMGIPESVKTQNGVLKNVLKRAVRGVIPDEIIDRPKQGFGVPVHEWLMQRLGQHAEDVVEEFLAETDYLDPNAARSLMRARSGTVSAWYVLNLALWWRRWIRT